jgi:type IV pilus assembly protein PilM
MRRRQAEAGFEPGCVLPSTLACLAAVDDAEPALLVNANSLGVTAAIVRGGVLLLHRSVDLQEHSVTTATPLAGAVSLPLVDAQETAGEWAAQEPLPEHGRNPYADQVEDEAAVQDPGSITGMKLPEVYLAGQGNVGASDLQPVPLSAEIAQAVSVAAAYFEDTLAVAPTEVIECGFVGCGAAGADSEGVGRGRGRWIAGAGAGGAGELMPEAVTASAPRAWLLAWWGRCVADEDYCQSRDTAVH